MYAEANRHYVGKLASTPLRERWRPMSELAGFEIEGGARGINRRRAGNGLLVAPSSRDILVFIGL